MSPMKNMANEPRETLHFEGMQLPVEAVLECPDAVAGKGIFGHGALLRAQQMVGAMERCLDYSLMYANDRVQFGKPIAKFPAVQAMLVEVACETAAAGAAVDAAVQSWHVGLSGQGHETFEFSVAIAKARAGEAAGKVASACHQVHGAIGFTHEHPLHYFTRRLWSWRDEFGSDEFWQREIGHKVCAAGGEAMCPQ